MNFFLTTMNEMKLNSPKSLPIKVREWGSPAESK